MTVIGKVKVALATGLLESPGAYAMALTVFVDATVTGAEYKVPAVALGVLPSTVYRIAAPEVTVEIVTTCVKEYDPAGGLNVGAATEAGPVMVSVNGSVCDAFPITST